MLPRWTLQLKESSSAHLSLVAKRLPLAPERPLVHGLRCPRSSAAWPTVGAAVTIIGELIEVIERQARATEALDKRMLVLTWVGVMLAFLQAVLAAVQIWNAL